MQALKGGFNLTLKTCILNAECLRAKKTECLCLYN